MAESTEVSGDVDSAGGKSRSATVAPRYFFAHVLRILVVSWGGASVPADTPFRRGATASISGVMFA